jgi:hypothetical protein
MLEWIILAPLFPIGIALGTYRSVKKMSAGPTIYRRPDLAPGIIAAMQPETATFLQAAGFSFAEAYAFHTLHIGVWTRPSGHPPLQSFSILRAPMSWTLEFMTEFSDNASLTTSTSRSAFMFPRGFGGFMQSFPKASISELWDAHQKGEEHLRSLLKLPISECRLTFEERVSRALVRQLTHVRSLPLWPIRGIYWFSLKRFLMHNRPIWTQNIPRVYKEFPDAFSGAGR